MTDWRLPEHRRKVFMDFYEFHLRYRAHPGCVYYLMPYLRDHYGWDDEQALWFAFLNGNTQHPVTSLIIHRRHPYPSRRAATYLADNYEQLEFDTDRRYHKSQFDLAVHGYLTMIGDEPQADFFNRAAQGGFRSMWYMASTVPTFGRLSAFSYLEYLRIMGVPFDCDTLLLDDMSGSKSHRNGLAIVAGLDEYDWHKSNPSFTGKYPPSVLATLKATGDSLLADMKKRAAGQPWENDVSFFTLESTLCTYKGWHRPDRRYPNVYNDMLHDRIRKSEQRWPNEDLSIFWQARADCLPPHLRLEDNPHDPGVHPTKQNHYRLTGEVIMMNVEYPEYANSFNQ